MRSLTSAVAAALVLLPAAPACAAGQPPVVVDDAVSYRNTGGIDYVVNALANDSDPGGDPLTYTAVTPADVPGRHHHDPCRLLAATDHLPLTGLPVVRLAPSTAGVTW